MIRAVVLLLLLVLPLAAQETRIASDFEIASSQRQLERERDPLLKMAAHLNLGDLYLTRGEVSIAQTHYRSSRDLAEMVRVSARRNSDLSSYANATAYLGLANAKLRRAAAAFDAFEEAMRYGGDSAKLWNLYASGMTLLDKPQKAAASARRAVAIAERSAADDPSAAVLLDLAVYKYALASALSEDDDEAEQLLREIVSILEGPKFDRIRDQIATQERFEVFSTTRSDADSYLSLMNRARLRLARIYEQRGATAAAIDQLRKVLELRTDDPTALTSLARLSANASERDQYFSAAFEANPFSMELIGQYESHVRSTRPADPAGDTTPRRVQRAVHAHTLGRYSMAAEQLDWLAERHPDNDVIRFLRGRNDLRLRGPATARSRAQELVRSPELRAELLRLIEAAEAASVLPAFLTTRTAAKVTPNADELRALITAIQMDQLPPETRARLDELTFAATARFEEPVSATEATTTFAAGLIEGIPFRFQQPTEFRGRFSGAEPLHLEFRILGVSQRANQSVLIIEPVRISR